MTDVGDIYGGWRVIEKAEKNRHGQSRWLCECGCGTRCEVNQASLRSGKSRGCRKCSGKRIGARLISHGASYHRLYHTWKNMMRRCYDPAAVSYVYYGERGITVCERWHAAEKFIEDMDPTFEEGLSLDRIDPEDGYSPTNCRWATSLEQRHNRRRT